MSSMFRGFVRVLARIGPMSEGAFETTRPARLTRIVLLTWRRSQIKWSPNTFPDPTMSFKSVIHPTCLAPFPHFSVEARNNQKQWFFNGVLHCPVDHFRCCLGNSPYSHWKRDSSIKVLGLSGWTLQWLSPKSRWIHIAFLKGPRNPMGHKTNIETVRPVQPAAVAWEYGDLMWIKKAFSKHGRWNMNIQYYPHHLIIIYPIEASL